MRRLLGLLVLLTLAVGVLAQEIPAPTDLNRSHPLAQGLQAWWIIHPSLAAGPTWWTLVGQTHGTLTNMGSGSGWQPSTRPGSPGEVRFDGTDDYIAMPAGTLFAFDTTRSYSWAFRLKPQSFSQWHTLFAMLDTAAGSNYFAIYVNNNPSSSWGPVTQGVSLGYSSTGFEILHSTDNVFSTGVWAHLVVTFDGTGTLGSRFKIYVNAVDVTSTVVTGAGTPAWTSTVVRLGSDSFGDPTWNGALTEVGLWSRALTLLEVRALYDATAPSYMGLLQEPPTRLVGSLVPPILRRKIIQPY